MVSDETRRRARAAIEHRLVRERAFFFGAMAAFITTLIVDLNGTAALDPFLYILIIVAGLTGAGYDGAREALKDLDLVAGFLESLGGDAKLEPMPFFTKGHYELWFVAPSPMGDRRIGLSFANSLIGGPRKSRYLLMVPLRPGKHLEEPAPAREPYTEMGTGGLLEARTIEYYLWSPRRGGPKEWRVLAYLKPGRPMDLASLVELASRAEAMAAKISREGAGAVAWGTAERFRPPRDDEIPPESRVELAEDSSN